MSRGRDDILQTIAAHGDAVRGYGVKRLGLFGSAARGEHRAGSDLDFVVEFGRKTFDNYMGLKAFLEALFACSVDLVLANTIKPRLRERILNEVVYVPGL
jgi:predicted nucleotidyltransferase